jgi:hypothetical protein
MIFGIPGKKFFHCPEIHGDCLVCYICLVFVRVGFFNICFRFTIICFCVVCFSRNLLNWINNLVNFFVKIHFEENWFASNFTWHVQKFTIQHHLHILRYNFECFFNKFTFWRRLKSDLTPNNQCKIFWMHFKQFFFTLGG